MATEDHTPTRICSKCKQSFPLTPEFWHKDKGDKSGLCYSCKECAKKKARDWGQENAEYVLERGKKYYAENKERIHKVYRAKNAEHIAEVKRDWRKKNPDKVKKHKSESQKRHRDKANERRKRSDMRHPERVRASTLTRIARKKGAPGKYTGEDITRMYEEQSGLCAYCGIRIYQDIPQDVHVDHVVPITKGGTNYPDNLVLCCKPCNSGKNNHLLTDWLHMRGW